MRAFSNVLALWICLLLAAPATGAIRLPNTKGWMTVQTEHFTVYSNARKGETRKLVADLERYREVLGTVTKGFQFDSNIPTSVFIFRNDGDFKPYKLGTDGKVKNWSGYFLEREEGEYYAFDASAGSHSRRVAYHEYVHSILHKTFSNIPLWLNEGLAEYYSTFRFRAQSVTAEVGHPIEHHVIRLKSDRTVDLAALFQTDHGSEAYNEVSLQGRFYAQSWVLVHYLASTNELRTAFGRFLTRLRAGDDPEDALLASLGKDEKMLTTELENYIQKGSSFYWVKLKDDVGRNIPEVTPMKPADTLLRLADLQSHRGPEELESVQKHITRALELGASEHAAYAILGYAEQNADHKDEAGRLFRKAIEGDEANPLAWTRLGLLLVDGAMDDLDVSSMDKEDQAPKEVLEARQFFRQSLEIDSSNVQALAGLGRTYLFGPGDVSLGVRVLASAATLRPFRTDILRDLACLLAKSGNTMASWAVIEDQLASKAKYPILVNYARQWALAAEIETANKRVEKGDIKGAVRVMKSAREHLEDPEVIAWLDETIQRFESDAVE